MSDGDCSGAVYMAIWDWCESELSLDVRFHAPQTEETLDCALLEGDLASKLLAALREQALLDRRLGKRRLLALEESMEQELDWVRVFYVIRMQAEGLMEQE